MLFFSRLLPRTCNPTSISCAPSQMSWAGYCTVLSLTLYIVVNGAVNVSLRGSSDSNNGSADSWADIQSIMVRMATLFIGRDAWLMKITRHHTLHHSHHHSRHHVRHNSCCIRIKRAASACVNGLVLKFCLNWFCLNCFCLNWFCLNCFSLT